jgi:hypothetical protein
MGGLLNSSAELDWRPTMRAFFSSAVVCSQQAPALTNWPIEQIVQTVQPTEAQQSVLNDLKDATGKAVTALQAECSDDLPSTPTYQAPLLRCLTGRN